MGINEQYKNKSYNKVSILRSDDFIQRTKYPELLDDSGRNNLNFQTRAESKRKKFAEKLINTEQNAWEQVLGCKVEVLPPPETITPEVINNLRELGFVLRCIPKVNIGTLSDLKKMGAEAFVDNIQKLCPNWQNYDVTKKDSNNSINLDKWTFWRYVEGGKTEFPNLPGMWVALETVPTPSFGLSFNGIKEAIKNSKKELLIKAGLPISNKVRMLKAIEFNLLGNRGDLNNSRNLEFTSTVVNNNGYVDPIVMGVDDVFDVHIYDPWFVYDSIYFRRAILLGT